MIERAASIIKRVVKEGRIPGAALGVVHSSGEPQTAVFGFAQLEPRRIALREQMFFDLASLTKVIFTLRETLRLVEEGLIDLDDPVSEFLPELAWMQESPLCRKTLRELLAHQSGLPAWAPVYTWGSIPHTLKAQLLQHRWALGEPVYSDIGYMLLGIVLERIRKKPLVEFALPDGLSFRPRAEDSVTTEHDPWRNRLLRGEVHDENAFAIGGAGGHAGLFGTLSGVLSFSQQLLAGELVSPAALIELRCAYSSTRALGFERKHPRWSGGSLTSDSAIGHTGFTGTGLWIDFERGYAWALLTNRVHPSRFRETGIIALRRSVGNVLAASWRPA